MSLSLLDIIPNSNGNYYFSGAANGIGEALIYALIGFLVVFLGIILIIFIIWLIGLILRKTNNLAFLNKLSFKRLKKGNSPEISQVEPDKETDEIPDEVKAAIIAAIMAYYDNEKPECEFIVRRIKKIEVC